MGRDGGLYDGPGADKVRAFREEQTGKRREFLKEQMQTLEKSRESLKGSDPKAALDVVIKNQEAFRAANVEFAAKQQQELVDFVTKTMQENNVAADKQKEVLDKLQSRFDEMTKQREAQHEKLMAGLKELQAKDGLTMDEIKAVMEKNREGRPGRGNMGNRPGRENRGGRQGQGDAQVP
jgi:molybdopterin converting factor small subunit